MAETCMEEKQCNGQKLKGKFYHVCSLDIVEQIITYSFFLPTVD